VTVRQFLPLISFELTMGALSLLLVLLGAR
jgi:hypothetical protein